MEILHFAALSKIRQNKAKLEKVLNVKISFSGKTISLEGNTLEEYVAANVIEAINLGFTLEHALLLREEEMVFEKIHIKDLTKRHDLERIRGRIIGTGGKTNKILEDLSDCFISVHDNTVGIIGHAEEIKNAMRALASLIHGSKQSKVYSYLERQRSREKIKINEDLGLKIKEKKGKH